jgi:hypothetical protein
MVGTGAPEQSILCIALRHDSSSLSVRRRMDRVVRSNEAAISRAVLPCAIRARSRSSSSRDHGFLARQASVIYSRRNRIWASPDSCFKLRIRLPPSLKYGLWGLQNYCQRGFVVTETLPSDQPNTSLPRDSPGPSARPEPTTQVCSDERAFSRMVGMSKMYHSRRIGITPAPENDDLSLTDRAARVIPPSQK